jgi:hypothetical protein
VKDGDANSRYFHSCIYARRRCTTSLPFVLLMGGWKVRWRLGGRWWIFSSVILLVMSGSGHPWMGFILQPYLWRVIWC